MPMAPPAPRRSGPSLLLALVATSAAACGGGSPEASGPTPAAGEASEAEWRALATPRPEPLDGAPRVTVAEVEVLAEPTWPRAPGVEPSLLVAELASAGLLRRRDVRFVERRRFAEAAAAERRGLPRPAGAPAAGISPGAELAVSASWASPGLDSAHLELRLTEMAGGAVVATARRATAPDAGPVSVARALVDGLLDMLEERGRLPEWSDPVPAAFRTAGVPDRALAAFVRGLAAEEEWRWEAARRGYQEALAVADAFEEARTALARAARLRMGATLGEG